MRLVHRGFVVVAVGSIVLTLAGCPWGDPRGGDDDCVPDVARVCEDNTIYAAGSCGNLGAPIEICRASDVCTGGVCTRESDLDATCAESTTCNDCVTRYPCGWCDGHCVAGSDGGGTSASCSSWSWTPAECTGDPPATSAFPDATPLVLARGEETVVSIDLSDIDRRIIFDLGPLSAGDEVRFHCLPNDSRGLPTAALFERDGTIADRVTAGGALQTRRRLASAYLGFMPYNGNLGQADVAIHLASPGVTPMPNPQLMYVEWGGGTSVIVHGKEPISFPAFDGSVLEARMSNETAWIMSRVLEIVRRAYTGAAVEIYSSHEGAPPDFDYSILYVGGSISRLLGLADSVDRGNGDTAQNAIVYIEEFSPFDAMEPTREEWAQLVANVMAHEMGHLLGLWHTAAPDDIMDTTGSAWDLAGVQAFSRADLEQSVFSVGAQDDILSLIENVGGDASVLGATTNALLYAARKREVMRERGDHPRFSLPGMRCGSDEL